MSLRTSSVLVILLGLLVGSWSVGAADPTPAPAAGATVPADEAPWWASWSRDADGDRLDDVIPRLESLGPAAFDDGSARYGVARDGDRLRYDVFVRFDHTPASAEVDAVERLAGTPVRAYPWAETVYVPAVPYARLAGLLSLPGVRGIELERVVVPMMEHALPALLVNDSSVLGLGARERWKVDGRDVGIAFLDTGIDEEHLVFDPTRFLGGYDATLPITTLQEGVEDPVVTPYNARNPDDDVHPGHGTHVASLAVANDPNGTYVGAAPAAHYLDVKVILNTPFDAFATSTTPFGLGSMVLEGLDFVRRYDAGQSHLGAPPVPIRVISMSIGEVEADADGTSVLSHAVNRMVDAGYSVVAAAGNCGPGGSRECCDDFPFPDDCSERRGNGTIPAPGAAKRAITVGALDGVRTVDWTDDFLAGFSSRGPNGGEPKPNLVAYGVGIMGAKGAPSRDGAAEDAYHALSGTSMATPFVAGIVALLYDANGTLTPEEVKAILHETARDVDAPGWDPGTGDGVVNTYFAVGVALGILDPKTTLLDATGHDIPRLKVPIPEQSPTPTPTRPPLANQAPRVDFMFGPQAPKPGEAVVFADRSTDPDRHKIISHVWDFGDGNVAKGDRLVHTYEKERVYKVRLTVTDELGLAASANALVRVGDPDEQTEESSSPGVVALLGVVALAAAAWRARRP